MNVKLRGQFSSGERPRQLIGSRWLVGVVHGESHVAGLLFPSWDCLNLNRWSDVNGDKRDALSVQAHMEVL